MTLLLSEDLNFILYTDLFPIELNLLEEGTSFQRSILSNSVSKSFDEALREWRILISISSDQSILAPSKSNFKCCCGKDVDQLCVAVNLYTKSVLILGYECIKKYCRESNLYSEYKIARRLVRKCKHCQRKVLITEMIGHCCLDCKQYRTSDYPGCISCLTFQTGTGKQCVNCRIAKRPYFKIVNFYFSPTFKGDFRETLIEKGILKENLELVLNDGLKLRRILDLGSEMKELIQRGSENCLGCGKPINTEEQLGLVPIDKLSYCLFCVFPNHSRCTDCNKFIQEGGKTKCTSCFKKFMKNCNKRQCITCGLFEIPDLPGDEWKVQCFSCWKKNVKKIIFLCFKA